MYSKYKKFIDQYVSLNPIEWRLLKSKLTRHYYKKGEIIHFSGDVCDRLSFVNSGLLRLYIIDEQGKDHTWSICFNGEHAQMTNLFVVDYDSFVNQRPSYINFEVLEDCELLSMSYDDMQLLYSRSKNAERFGRLMAELSYSYTHNLIVDRLTKSASERFELFMQQTPYLLEKVPQYHIASLLDMTPQHLSRLKKLSNESM